MTESMKTGIYAAIAVLFLVVAWATQPKDLQPEDVQAVEEGGDFFPDLSDTERVKAMEIQEYNEDLGQAKPFKVQQEKDGSWTIPSHSGYPADAKERLAKTAGAIIGLKRDSFRTNNKEEHAEFGVVDPGEKGLASTGWGTHVKLFDESDNTIVDLIVGDDMEDKNGWKYIRKADEESVYAVNAKDLDLSIKFSDWIDRDLLDVSSYDIEKLSLRKYLIQANRLVGFEDTLIEKNEDSKWVIEKEKLGQNEETDESKVGDLARALDNLKIVGVRQKPEGLQPNLQGLQGLLQVEQMRYRGFYPTQDGDVISPEGEIRAETKDGIIYTLRFGGIILGTGDEVTAGTQDEKAAGIEEESEKKEEGKDESAKEEEEDEVQENRFLLVSVSFDENKFPPIPDDETATEPAQEKEDAQKTDADGKIDSGKQGEAGEEKKDSKENEETDEAKALKTDTDGKVDSGKQEEAGEEKKDSKENEETDEAKAQKTDDEKIEEADKIKKKREELEKKRKEREEKVEKGKQKAEELSNRYANWYYVVSEEEVKKIRLTKADLVKEKEKEEEEKEDKGEASSKDEPEKKAEDQKTEVQEKKDDAKESATEEKPAPKEGKNPTNDEVLKPKDEAKADSKAKESENNEPSPKEKSETADEKSPK